MNPIPPSQETLTRRQFLVQTAVVGGALAAPVNLFGQAKPDDAGEGVEVTELPQGWSLKSIKPCAGLSADFLNDAERASASDGWLAIKAMPAMVHDVLLAHGKIEEPWSPGGTEKCYWVREVDWVYSTRFAAPAARKSSLRFLGLEGAVDVYLNGKSVASHSDVTSPLVVDVAEVFRPANTLVLHFRAGTRKLEDAGATPHRNALGSYLGPNPALNSVGVFDQVLVEQSDGSALTEVLAVPSLDKSLIKGTLRVHCAGVSRLPSAGIRVRLLDPEGHVAAETAAIAKITNGVFNSSCVVNVDHPRLWWPRGYGSQPLYRAEIALMAGDRPLQTVERTIGFRRITMPEHLHFVVNNVPVFLRGGAWVTPDLMSRVWDAPRMERLFAMAENANFNAFRLWAQVAAPHDKFYEMADARGFLLWQDFGLLPLKPDDASRALCRERATQQLKRLRHHASILCWCGGNEEAMWFHEDYHADYKDHGPWPGLAAGADVGAICQQLDPDRYYQPTTPFNEHGMNPNDPRAGDTHGYTNIAFVPGYDYLKFTSEDTRIAAPPLHSLRRFMAPEDLWPADYSTLAVYGNKYPFPKTWLPYTTGASWSKTGPVEQFYDATDPAALVYRLGMAEALYYRDTVERQRRGRPADEAGDRRCCGGYIVWKYNDSWPQIYSAKVDYFLEPYHAYYELRRAYAPVMLSFEIGSFIWLWAVNDSTSPVTGRVKIQLYHLERHEFRKEITREITVPPGKSSVVVRLDQAGIRAFRREHILFATLTDKTGNVLARTNDFVNIERRLTFPEARLDVQVQNGVLQITTDKFARCVTLEGNANGDPFGWFFEDNYFDLLPGELKTVRILGSHRQGRVTAKAQYSKNAATLEWQAM